MGRCGRGRREERGGRQEGGERGGRKERDQAAMIASDPPPPHTHTDTGTRMDAYSLIWEQCSLPLIRVTNKMAASR